MERHNETAGAALPESPAGAALTEDAEGACGFGRSTSWRSGDVTFDARLLVGPDASPADLERVLATLRGLAIEDPVAAESWHRSERGRDSPLDVFIDEPKDVVAMPREPGFPEDYIVLVPLQSNPREAAIGYAGMDGIGGTLLDIKPSDPFHFAGDTGQVTADGGPVVVRSIGYAALDVDRVVLLADDRREVALTLGPSLAPYGVDLRPTFVRFKAPARLLGGTR
ncbi:MAG: hypothetical protein ABWZ53_07495 [Actinomycetota bacterium]